jgi:hypothetical protein
MWRCVLRRARLGSATPFAAPAPPLVTSPTIVDNSLASPQPLTSYTPVECKWTFPRRSYASSRSPSPYTRSTLPPGGPDLHHFLRAGSPSSPPLDSSHKPGVPAVFPAYHEKEPSTSEDFIASPPTFFVETYGYVGFAHLRTVRPDLRAFSSISTSTSI